MVGLLLAGLVVGGCEDSSTLSWCGGAAGGGETIVASGKGIWGGKEPARLEELWRAGGLNEGEELVYPVSLTASRTGRLAISDFQLSEVLVIEQDGTWRGPWGRPGQGPGELGTPVTATWDAAGRLVVFDITAPKVLFLNEDGPARPDLAIERSFTAPIVASGELTWVGVRPDGDVLLQPSPQPLASAEKGMREALLLRLAPGAAIADTLARDTLLSLAEGPWWGLPGAPQLLRALGPDGQLAIAPAEAVYRIVVQDAAGTPIRQICRDVPPLPITARERGEGAEGFEEEEVVRAVREATPADPPQPIGRLFWGARGRLWVQRDRRAPLDPFDPLFGAPGGLYDVYDEEGAYLGEVRAPPRARLQTAAGDTVYAFEYGDLDEAWVVAYRIVHN